MRGLYLALATLMLAGGFQVLIANWSFPNGGTGLLGQRNLRAAVTKMRKIAVENGAITEIAAPVTPPDGAVPALDLTGFTVVPGFVDMHVHGGGGASYHSGNAEQIIRTIGLFHMIDR